MLLEITEVEKHDGVLFYIKELVDGGNNITRLFGCRINSMPTIMFIDEELIAIGSVCNFKVETFIPIKWSLLYSWREYGESKMLVGKACHGYSATGVKW